MSDSVTVSAADVAFVDGLAYRRAGSGEPVVLLHPLALAGDAWGEFADRLATRLDVIAVDARGHGRSAWDGGPFTVEDLADDVGALLDGLRLDAAHLVGMSMGGSTAVAFAGRHPDRARTLFLADTTAWYGPEAPQTWAERAQNVQATPRQRQVPFQVDRWFTEGFRRRHTKTVNHVVNVFLRTDSAAHAQACLALGGMDSRPVLGEVTAPALVVTGVEDYATPPEMGATIADGVRHGKAETLPALRHLSLIEQPALADRVAEHVAAGA
jgi:3-oxoadipate enol-lactonase